MSEFYRSIPPDQLLSEARRLIEQIEYQNPHLRTSQYNDQATQRQMLAYLEQVQIERKNAVEAQLGLAQERAQHQQALARMREDKEFFGKRATELEQVASNWQRKALELEKELAAYKPDPNDPRDWSAEPFWQSTGAFRGQGQWVQPEKESVEQQQEVAYHPGRLEKFFDFCDYPAVRYGSLALVVLGYAVASHFHL